MIWQALLNYFDTSMSKSDPNREDKKWVWLSLKATILVLLPVILHNIINFDALNGSSHHSWSMA